MLSYEEKDILKELMNVFVGEAASLLSEITNRKIHLTVPNLQLLSPQDKNNLTGDTELPDFLKGTLMASSLSFGNKFNGKAELVFPTEKIKLLTAICTNEEIDFSDESLTFDDTDFDVMKEVGNIILNSIIGGIGNSLNIKLEYSIPQIEIFDMIHYKKRLLESEQLYVLILFVSFKIDETEIIGVILINFTLNSISFILDKINEIRDEFYE